MRNANVLNVAFLGLGLGTLAIFGSTQANATLMLCEGAADCTLQGSGIENVLLPAPGTTGQEIIGVTNQTNTEVRFFGHGDTLITDAGGQARLDSIDGIIDQVTIDTVDTSLGFEHVVFNVLTELTQPGQPQDSNIFIEAIDNFGTVFDFGGGPFNAATNGNNWFTIGSDDVQYIDSFTIWGDGILGIADLQNVRVDPDLLPGGGGGTGNQVSEPGTMALFGLGLLGLVQSRRRVKRVA